MLLRNARTQLAKEAARDVGVGLAAVGIGLFSGLLPPNWAEVFALLGGASGAKGVETKGLRAFDVPPEVQANRLFFLWKVRGR